MSGGVVTENGKKLKKPSALTLRMRTPDAMKTLRVAASMRENTINAFAAHVLELASEIVTKVHYEHQCVAMDHGVGAAVYEREVHEACERLISFLIGMTEAERGMIYGDEKSA